jgi:lysyl-tRNA synthetase class I
MFGSLGQVLCAACGSKMEVTLIEPVHDNGSEITFQCNCGHTRQFDISRRMAVGAPSYSAPA